MKKRLVLRFTLFLIIPLIVFEIAFSTIPFFNNHYLKKLDPFYDISMNANRQYFFFFGSSRVAASIVEKQFDDRLKQNGIYTINAGRGMTTSTTYYLAMRTLECRGLLEKSTVFLEAPCGMCSLNDNYESYWVDDRNIHAIIPYLNFSILTEFWKYSKNNFSTKISVTFNYFFYTNRIFSLLKEIFNRNSLHELYIKIFKIAPVSNQNLNLVNRGGIMVDSLSIINARKLAIEYANLEIKEQYLITFNEWNKSRLNDIFNLAKANNSRLILFKMPLSSIQAKVYETKIGKQNINILKSYLDYNKITYHDMNFSEYSDDDFPDLWHISSQRAPEFSNSLIDSLQKSELF
ncbi:MAG: hypothetical protein R6W78_18000 [Bacteroidales bacterium]